RETLALIAHRSGRDARLAVVLTGRAVLLAHRLGAADPAARIRRHRGRAGHRAGARRRAMGRAASSRRLAFDVARAAVARAAVAVAAGAGRRARDVAVLPVARDVTARVVRGARDRAGRAGVAREVAARAWLRARDRAVIAARAVKARAVRRVEAALVRRHGH